MKMEELEDPIDEIRRIVRNWWTAWMDDDKVETRLKCFNLLGSEKFQIVAKHVFLEEISSGRYRVPIIAIKKLLNNFEEFVASNETQLAAKVGIINCLRVDNGKVYKIETIKQYLENFGVPENFLNSLDVKQAAEVAIVNSLSGGGNEEFYRISHFFFPCDLFSGKNHVYSQDVRRAASKWILNCLNKNKGGVDSTEIVSRIKNIGIKFGVPDVFYSSAEFELAMKGWILRFLDSYHQMSAEDLVRCGYVSFTDQESEILLNTLKDEFGIVEKIIYSPEVQQTIKERRLAVKIISDKIKKQIETIRNNTRQGPF